MSDTPKPEHDAWTEAEVRQAIRQSIAKGDPPLDLIIHGLMLYQRLVLALEAIAAQGEPQVLFELDKSQTI